MQRLEAEETFEIAGKDAQRWLAQARQLRISADIIKRELQNEIPIMSVAPEADERFLALMKSFMMLTGMAIENLMKGVLIGRDPSLVNQLLISDKLLPRGGHGISQRAKEICPLDNEELDLLKRLEEFLFWAGRYVMPLKSRVYLASQTPENLLSFTDTDFHAIENIYSKMAGVLENEWQLRERSQYA